MEFTNVSVLLTRSSRDNVTLANRIRRRGGRVLESPLVDVQYCAAAVITPYLLQLAGYEAVVVTSGNAFRAIAQTVPREPMPLPRRCYTVGQASTRLGEALGWQPVVPDGVKTGYQLATFITSRFLVPPQPRRGAFALPTILWLRGNRPERKTFEVFQTVDHAVDQVVCYETVARPLDPLAWQQLSATCHSVVVLYSPSAVAALVSSPAFCDFTSDRTPKYVAIGPTTAQALQRHGLNTEYVASEPTEEAVWRVLERTILEEEA